ncbi:hypothetical protein EJ02DRAFT_244177 [Clathrospora elynae]|uniref:Uncharacterized protein n=1 Tax=Clathrospora elynae TaxID=706981 RepID=A0A6A5SJ34_9PLEO|nr:hypothetical protein EJ02DRAFT_244177 [Clathrospora elynae]
MSLIPLPLTDSSIYHRRTLLRHPLVTQFDTFYKPVSETTTVTMAIDSPTHILPMSVSQSDRAQEEGVGVQASTGTVGDDPIVISMAPATTATVTASPSIMIISTVSSFLPIAATTIHSSTVPSVSFLDTPGPSTRTFSTSTGPTAPFSKPPSKPSAGLGAAASIGLGVSLGVAALLIIAGVLYVVFGRYLKGMRREGRRDLRLGA